jgi:glycosyltransferase involved in cell wall biosynthesis
MRIAIFIHSLGCGGAERVAANLANHWAKRQWEIVVITVDNECADFYQLDPRIARITLEPVSLGGKKKEGAWHNIKVIKNLRDVLTGMKPDVVISIMVTSNIQLAISGLFLRIKLIGAEQIHPPACPAGVRWGTLRTIAYFFLDQVVAPSASIARWLDINSLARKVITIPQAIEWPITPVPPTLDTHAICGTGRKLMLAVGRLVYQKGFDLLISAFSALRSYLEWDLVIIGEGPLRGKIEEQIRANGLEQRVALPGLSGNIGDWYERAEIYVMSSRFEGFGNTLAEALTYGCPVVSFDCEHGPRDIIRHNVDGLLVPALNVEALTAALETMMKSPELRESFSRRAVEIRERVSIEYIASLWEDLF